MFGLARFKNEGYTYYIYQNIVFTVSSLCLGSHSLRTRNIYIALAPLGSHTLCSLQMAYRSTVYFSTGAIGTSGTNRQVVSARLSSVNICSLQMEHRSAASFSIGAIGSNGTNGQIIYARLSGVNICILQIVYQSINYVSNGIDLNQWHQSTNCLRMHGTQVAMRCRLQMVYQWTEKLFIRTNGTNRKASLTNGGFLAMVPLVRVSRQLVSICVCWTWVGENVT